jgi:hypothetical protein
VCKTDARHSKPLEHGDPVAGPAERSETRRDWGRVSGTTHTAHIDARCQSWRPWSQGGPSQASVERAVLTPQTTTAHAKRRPSAFTTFSAASSTNTNEQRDRVCAPYAVRWAMRSTFSVEARRVIPKTSWSFSRSNSAR